jgi:hypothetical protein
MSIAIVSDALADICFGSAPTHVGYLSMALASVALVAVMFFLVKLSLDTLRQFSEQESPLELLEAEDGSDYASD